MVNARKASIPIRNFSRATATIFRGSAPDLDGLEFLSSLGIKTVIDLRQPGTATDCECLLALGCRLNYFNIPMHFLGLPDTALAAFFAISLHPRYQPIFLHCTEGQVRTSVLIAVFHIAVEGWPFEWAYSEMLSRGFQPWQVFLKYRVKRFESRLKRLTLQQRLWALQEFVHTYAG